MGIGGRRGGEEGVCVCVWGGGGGGKQIVISLRSLSVNCTATHSSNAQSALSTSK